MPLGSRPESSLVPSPPLQFRCYDLFCNRFRRQKLRRSTSSRKIGSRRSPRFLAWYIAPGYLTLGLPATRRQDLRVLMSISRTDPFKAFHLNLLRNSLSMIEGGPMPEAQMAAKVSFRLNGLPVASAWWLARAIILSGNRTRCLRPAGKTPGAEPAGKALDGFARYRQSFRPNQLHGTRSARSSSI
jgi:hypothetical protein